MPIDRVRVGIVGIEGVEIRAVCDLIENRVVKAQRTIQDAWQKKPYANKVGRYASSQALPDVAQAKRSLLLRGNCWESLYNTLKNDWVFSAWGCLTAEDFPNFVLVSS